MNKEKTLDPRFIYKILLSIVIIVAGICLMTACLGIYRSGDQPFSRESVAAAFSGIAVPVYLCLVMIAAGFVLEFFLPRPAKKNTPEKNIPLILERLQVKTDLNRCDNALRGRIEAQRKTRRLHKIISIALLILGSVVFLSYGLNPHNFHQSQINDSMAKAMGWLVPCMVVPFGYAVFTAYRSRASMEAEIALLKTAPKESITAPKMESVQSEAKKLAALRCVVLAVGICLLVYGFLAGGTADVLTKAVNICTECVGLG